MPSWRDCLPEYRAHLDASLARRSAATYFGWAQDFARLADEHGWGANSPELLRQYARLKIEAAIEKGPVDGIGVRKRRATLTSSIPAIKRFFQWLRERGAPVAEQYRPQLPRLGAADQFVPTREEYGQIMRFAAGYTDPYGAIFQLLAYTGMRESEMAGLTLDDADDIDGRIVFRVRGKGDKPRNVPMLAEGRPVLAAWLARRAKHPIGAKADTEGGPRWLFPVLTAFMPGNPKPGDGAARVVTAHPVARATVEMHMRKLRDRVGLGRLTTHALRRYYVSRQRRAGMAESDIAAILGHSNLALFMTYYKPTAEELSDAVARAEGAQHGNRPPGAGSVAG